MEYFHQRFIDELNDEGDVEVAAQRWTRHQVLHKMDEVAERDIFNGWVNEQKLAAKERARAFLGQYGSLNRFNTLVERHRNGFVTPFVGAGMSRPSGFPLWGPFLLSLLADAPEAEADVRGWLDNGDYERAAQCVFDALGADVLAEEILNVMGSHNRRASGPVCLLPSLFAQEVFTTNFDYVLDRAYLEANLRFAREYKGTELRQALQRMGNDPHCLFRLHGEADAPDNRVLTLREYQATYDDNAGLSATLANLVGPKSLLFMGCSLNTDRTFAAFRAVKAAANGVAVRHYAFLPAPGSRGRRDRRAELAEAEIHPIYYPPEDHDQAIEDLLITMMEGGF